MGIQQRAISPGTSPQAWWHILEVVCSTTKCGCFINKHKNIKVIYLSRSKGLPVACGTTQLTRNPWFMRNITLLLRIYFKLFMQHKRGLVLFWGQAWGWLSFISFLQLRWEISTCLPLLWVSCQSTSSVHVFPLSGSFFSTGSRSVWSPASSSQHYPAAVCLWHLRSSFLEEGVLLCRGGTDPLSFQPPGFLCLWPVEDTNVTKWLGVGDCIIDPEFQHWALSASWWDEGSLLLHPCTAQMAVQICIS